MRGAGSFKVSDPVMWDSQAGGNWKTKQGTVVAVIPPKGGREALKKYGLCSMNSSRDHESYVVHVPSKTGRGKGTFYWPVVSNLRKVG